MTRDEVLSMAAKCSLLNGLIPVPSQFLHFAEAVAAHEREACALVCDEQMTREPYGHAKHAAGQCAENIRARATTPKETE